MKFYLTILIIFFELHSCEKNELNVEIKDNKKQTQNTRVKAFKCTLPKNRTWI